MKNKRYSLTTSSDDDGIFTDQTISGAGSLTLDGALVQNLEGTDFVLPVTGDGGAQILITSAGNDSGINFTITGENENGLPITDTVVGPNAATETSSQYFSKITDIETDGASAGNVKIGTNGVAATPAFIPTSENVEWKASISLDITGTIDVTVKHSMSQQFAETGVTDLRAMKWHDHDAASSPLVNVTADATGTYEYPVSAIQGVVNSSNDGASVAMDIITQGH